MPEVWKVYRAARYPNHGTPLTPMNVTRQQCVYSTLVGGTRRRFQLLELSLSDTSGTDFVAVAKARHFLYMYSKHVTFLRAVNRHPSFPKRTAVAGPAFVSEHPQSQRL